MDEPDTMPDDVRRLRAVSEIEARVARLNARWDAEYREFVA